MTTLPPPPPPPTGPSRWPAGALAGLALALLLSSLGTSIANVALPTLAEALGASFGEVQWVVLTYLLGITTSIVGFGRLGDLCGRRRTLLWGLGLFVAGAAASGLAPGLPLLLVARLVQGVGAAALMALTLAFVSDIVPKERAGSAMGLLGTTSAVGTALGPSLGGLLTAGLGWRAVFLVQLPLGLAAWLLLRPSLPADLDRRGRGAERFDLPGTLLLATSLAAWSLAATLGRGHLGLTNLACLAAALLGGGLFVRVERRSPSPLVPLALLRDPALRAGLGKSLLVSTVLMATLVVGPFHLSRALGLGAGPTGLAMAVGPLAAALGGVPAGRLVDHLGARRSTRGGLVGIGAGALALALGPEAAGLPGYLGPIVLITASYALFQAANNTAVLEPQEAGRRGVVSAMLTLSRNLGLVTGAALLGALFDLASGPGDLAGATASAVAAGTRVTFGVGVALIGAAALLPRPPSPTPRALGRAS